MSGTTPKGWPYVTPDDHPKEYPAHSQALALALDATQPPVSGDVTPAVSDANGVIEIPHALGRTPQTVIAQITAGTADLARRPIVLLLQFDSASFRVQLLTGDTWAPIANSSAEIAWITFG